MSCDGCTLCCTLLEVHELRKPVRTVCVHCTDTGCGRYETRPQSCRTFECAWLVSQRTSRPLPAELRPDRSGVVLGQYDDGRPVAFVDPTRHDWRQGPMGRFLADREDVCVS